MNPATRITTQLQALGPTWAATDECASLLLDAAGTPAEHRRALEALEAYGRRQDAEAAARALRASRTEQALHDLPQALERWAAEHRDRFAPSSGGEPWGGWWGVWDEHRGCVWLRADVLTDIMDAWGLQLRRATRALRARGLLVGHGQAHGRLSARKRMGSRLTCAYGVRLRRIEPDADAARRTDRVNDAAAKGSVTVSWPGAVLASVAFAVEAQ